MKNHHNSLINFLSSSNFLTNFYPSSSETPYFSAIIPDNTVHTLFPIDIDLKFIKNIKKKTLKLTNLGKFYPQMKRVAFFSNN